MFNNVRSNFYNQAVWTNGYPAATGIGTNLGGVLVDIDAAVFTRPALSKEINKMMKEGLVIMEGKRIEILDKTTLEKYL